MTDDDNRETDIATLKAAIYERLADFAAGRVKVEHDDAAAAATALGLPLRVVMDRATALASALGD